MSVFPLDDSIPTLLNRIRSKEPDLVEYRLDYLTESSALETIAKSKVCPLIAADRSGRKQSGAFLLKAADVGFDFIDVDLSFPLVGSIIEQLKIHDVGVIVSYHDYLETPLEEKLVQLLLTEREMGGNICKIVTTANQPADNLIILRFINKCSPTTKIVSFAMGKLGMTSRVLSPFFGAEFTFASLDDESKTAQGQMSIDDLRKTWKMLGIS